MHLLSLLTRQPPRRHYALLDEERRCRMQLTAAERPKGESWIEIPEIRPEWIGKKLPSPADENQAPGSP